MMTKKQQTANAMLWAAAIISSALLTDSTTLSIVLLPGLAMASLLTMQHPRGCGNRIRRRFFSAGPR